MRIALLSDTYAPQVNGVTTVVERIVRVLREFGHDVVAGISLAAAAPCAA